VWFDKIKSGEKNHEYRLQNKFWNVRIGNLQAGDIIGFACGYPKKEEIDKFLTAKIVKITKIDNGINTDLKVNAPIYDIEFTLL
jgi:hypothetical protein